MVRDICGVWAVAADVSKSDSTETFVAACRKSNKLVVFVLMSILVPLSNSEEDTSSLIISSAWILKLQPSLSM